MRIWSCTSTSSAETGSSHTISSGFSASARAIATRWRCPPESSAGYRRWKCEGRATWSMSSSTRARRCLALPRRYVCSGSSMIRPTVNEGLSEEKGSWNTACTRCRKSLSPSPFSASTSLPSKLISPEVGSISLSSMRAVVVLPEPDSPTIETVLPRGIFRETSFTAMKSSCPRTG